SFLPSFSRPMRHRRWTSRRDPSQIDIGLVLWSRDLLRVERRMAKKPVASASDVIGAITRLTEAVEKAFARIEDIANAIGRIEKAIAKNHPASHIIADKRYRPHEAEQFGIKRGILYKHYRHLMRTDEKAHTVFVLGADLLRLNETAPAASTVAIPHRR